MLEPVCSSLPDRPLIRFTSRIFGAFPYPDDELLDDMAALFLGAIRSLAPMQEPPDHS
jgi:hypothetical protein